MKLNVSAHRNAGNYTRRQLAGANSVGRVQATVLSESSFAVWLAEHAAQAIRSQDRSRSANLSDRPSVPAVDAGSWR